MSKVLEEYVVTGNGFPEWLKTAMMVGKAKVNSEDGEFQNISLSTASGTLVAHKGDRILLLRSGMVVVPADAARKYMGGAEL